MESPWEVVRRSDRQAKIIRKWTSCKGSGDISVRETCFILIQFHSFLLSATEMVEIVVQWIITQNYCNELVYGIYGSVTVHKPYMYTQEEIFNQLMSNRCTCTYIKSSLLCYLSSISLQIYTALAFIWQHWIHSLSTCYHSFSEEKGDINLETAHIL